MLLFPYLRSEWESVKEVFDPSNSQQDVTLLKSAVEQMVAWKLRSRSDLPLVLDISELLLRAELYEKLDIGSELGSWWKSDNIRLLYAIALVRFVNFADGLGRRYQAPSASSRTIVNVVQQLNIPQWIVEQRHSVAHRHLPPLDLLREAVLFCKSWLWDIYWCLNFHQAAGISESNEFVPVQNQTQIQNKIFAALIEFEKARSKQLSKAYTKDNELYDRAVQEISRLIKRHTNIFLDVFVSEGHLILNDEQRAAAEMPEELDAIPQDLQDFFLPLWSQLEEQSAMPQLLQCLVSRLSLPHSSSPAKNQMKHWVSLLINSFSGHSQWQEHEWKEILTVMLSAPEHYNITDLEKVAGCVPSIGANCEEALLQLLAIYKGDGGAAKGNENIPWHSVDDFASNRCELEPGTGIKSLEPARWSVDTVHSWHQVPLGLMPGQTRDTIDLRLTRPSKPTGALKRKIPAPLMEFRTETKKNKTIETIDDDVDLGANSSVICLD